MDSQQQREQGTEGGEDEEKTKATAQGPKLTSPNAPFPMTLTVLKSLKPIFVLRSLKNCDCVRVCFLISRNWRSSGTPARDLSSSAPLNNAAPSSPSQSKKQNARQRHPGRRSQIDVATRARQTTHAPDVQVDRGLERKAVMGLQLDLGCRRAGAGFGREVVRAALIVDVICGLLRRRLRGQRLLWLRNGGDDGDRGGGGRGTGKGCAVYDFTVVVHGGGIEG